MSTADRPCVVGECRCGGWGIVHDEQAERETGLCHEEISDTPLTAAEEAYFDRARRIADATPEPSCSWCYGEALVGNREDAGRVLTEEEAAGGFFATHSECQEKMDGFFAELASWDIFVDVYEGGGEA